MRGIIKNPRIKELDDEVAELRIYLAYTNRMFSSERNKQSILEGEARRLRIALERIATEADFSVPEPILRIAKDALSV